MEYIFVSPMIEGSSSQFPHRVVAYKRDNAFHPERAYVTHIEVDPRNSRNVARYKISGHYDLTFEEAIEDAIERYNTMK